MKRALIAVVLTALFFTSGLGEEKARKVENFTLKDYNGVDHSLTDYKDAKAIVLMFIATQCPVSNAYNERMEALYKDYLEKNVVFLGINSNKQESVEEVKSHAKEKGLEFTILKDHNNVVADKLEASFTPEIYVLNQNGELLYHGRIDDSRQEGKVEFKDLRKALDEILAGKSVSIPATKAFGCTIKRVS